MGQSLRRFHAVHIPVFPHKAFRRKGQVMKSSAIDRKKSIFDRISMASIFKPKSSRVNYINLDLDNLQLDTFCIKPRSLEDLVKNTKFTKRELKIMYRGFKQECPNGVMDINKFIQIYKSFFPQGNAEPYACHIHRTMLKRNDNPITFDKLVTELSVLTYGSPAEKLEWVFDLYDVQKYGYICKKDFLDVVHSIYQLLGERANPPVTKSNIIEHANSIFEKLDINCDDEISIEEFKSAYMDDSQFLVNIQALSTHL